MNLIGLTPEQNQEILPSHACPRRSLWSWEGAPGDDFRGRGGWSSVSIRPSSRCVGPVWQAEVPLGLEWQWARSMDVILHCRDRLRRCPKDHLWILSQGKGKRGQGAQALASDEAPYEVRAGNRREAMMSREVCQGLTMSCWCMIACIVL